MHWIRIAYADNFGDSDAILPSHKILFLHDYYDI